MHQLLECRNFIVKMKRLRVNPSSNQRNKALQEQCTNNLFETDSRKTLQIPKDIKKVVNKLKRTQCESTIQPLSSNVPKGCKPLIVKVQRINRNTLQKENTEGVVGPIQNTIVVRRDKNMQTKNSIKKGISVKTSNSCKELANSLNINMKQNGLMVSNNPILKRNINIENIVLTPEHRKSLNKLSLSKNTDEGTIYNNYTKNLDISEFSPVKNSTNFEVDESTLSDGKGKPGLPISNSKGEKIPRNVTNNSDLIEQLICSNEVSELEHDQHEDNVSDSNSKEKEILKSVTNNSNELNQLICSNEQSEVGHVQHENEMRRSNSKGEKIVRNLTNNPDVLEQLICSNEDSGEEPDTTRCKPTENNNTANKFFQRLPKRKFRPRKIVTEPDNIFEFLSQSDTSESDLAKNRDPAADIIKKLISEGKVRVATNQKGTGRPILKRGRLKTTRKKQEDYKNKASKKKENKKNYGFNKKLPKIVETPDNCGDGTNFMVGNEDVSMVDYNQQQNFLTNDIKASDEHKRDEGFSLLARSVLLQETKKAGNNHKTNISEQRRLLEAAHKIVSTPAAKRQTNPLPTVDLSPIKFLSPQKRPMCPSPWRINDESHLPSVFNFTKNKSYLPTFSSDYIPSTPNKNKANDSKACINSNVINPKPISTGRDNSCNVSRNTASSASNGQFQASLECENDSNVENMPPTALTVPNNDNNAAIFNLRQLPNPRRTLGKRSPLKAINIIEVVSLPSWKKTVNDEVDKNVDATVTGGKNDNSNDEDLFGFEEFLDQNSDDDVQTNKTNVKLPNRQSIKRNLHRKLKDIQNWRPKNTSQGNTCVSQKACDVFEYNGPKQRLINEMLCSTMINMKNDKQNEQNNLENCDEFSMSDTEEGNVQPPETDFFNDYEPETTFDKKKTLRTYVRPAKRKRKARKQFVMFEDSEESSSDTEEEQLEQRKDGQKKRRHEAHGNAKATSEIEAFAKEFNSMCKDVDNYELLVE